MEGDMSPIPCQWRLLPRVLNVPSRLSLRSVLALRDPGICGKGGRSRAPVKLHGMEALMTDLGVIDKPFVALQDRRDPQINRGTRGGRA
jgi:hypothetical protein